MTALPYTSLSSKSSLVRRIRKQPKSSITRRCRYSCTVLLALTSVYYLGKIAWSTGLITLPESLAFSLIGNKDGLPVWYQPTQFSVRTSPTAVKNLGNNQQANQAAPLLLELRYGPPPANLPLSKSYQYYETPICQSNLKSASSKCQINYPVTSELLQQEKEQLTKGTDPINKPSDWFAITQKGQKDSVTPIPLPNQDKSFILQISNNDANAQPQLVIFLADGHGDAGHVSAELAVLTFPKFLLNFYAKSLKLPVPVEQMLKDVFLQTDQGLIQRIQNSGSTALLAWQVGTMLYFASAGDSIGVLASYDQTNHAAKVLAKAVCHKPNDPAERARIESHGGHVWLPPDEAAGSSRVILMDPKNPGQVTMALAMSRCLGDSDGKVANLLIAEPSVVPVDLTQYSGQNLFIVVASDGVVDHNPLDRVLLQLGETLFRPQDQENKNPTEQNNSLEQTSVRILIQAAEGWSAATQGQYRDDMTLLVSKISV